MLVQTDMHEPTKELDQLRRLAEMLRQAWGAGDPTLGTKEGPSVKKLRGSKRADTLQAGPVQQPSKG